MWEVKALKKETPKDMKGNSQKLKTPSKNPVRHPARGESLWVTPEHVVPVRSKPKVW